MTDRKTAPPDIRPASVLQATLVVAVVIIGALLLWQLADVVLLVFAAVLLAVILRSVAGLMEAHTPIVQPWSLALSVLLIAALVGAFMYLLGAQVHAQGLELATRIPKLIEAVAARLGIEELRDELFQRLQQLSGGGVVGKVAGYTSGVIGALVNVVLVVFSGIYLAADPALYRRGALHLVPRSLRKEAGAAFDNAGQALRQWLVGQLVAMAIVGMLITAGLYAIGMPSALALGFLAGMLEFVPIVGPVLSAIIAILIALSEDSSRIFWVIGLYVLVQQLENHLILPLLTRRTVDVPPAVTLFTLLSLGILFGPLGVMLGAPLTVVLYVAVKQFYVRDTLGEKTTVPGEGS